MQITRGPGSVIYVGPSHREIRQRQERLARMAASNYAERSNDELDELVNAGYTQAKYEIGERKVRAFLEKHPNIPKELKGFPIIFSFDEGVINLNLRVPAFGFSTRQLRGAERELERIRKVLRPYQLRGVASDIVAWKKEGQSDSQIARQLNELIADNLTDYRAFEYLISKVKAPDGSGDLKERMEEAKGYVLYLLQEMGFSKAETHRMVTDALEVISAKIEKVLPSINTTIAEEEAYELAEDDLHEEFPPGWDESLIIYVDTRDQTREFIQWTQSAWRAHRKGQPYRRPITAAHVRAKLKSLHLP